MNDNLDERNLIVSTPLNLLDYSFSYIDSITMYNPKGNTKK